EQYNRSSSSATKTNRRSPYLDSRINIRYCIFHIMTAPPGSGPHNSAMMQQFSQNLHPAMIQAQMQARQHQQMLARSQVQNIAPGFSQASLSNQMAMNPSAPATQLRPAVNSGVLRLHQFGEALSGCREHRHNIAYWKKVIGDYFMDNAVMRYTSYHSTTKDQRLFEIPSGILPRYFLMNHESGIRQMQLLLDGPRDFMLPTGMLLVECPRASIIYWFENGIQVTVAGHLRVFYLPGVMRIDTFDFLTQSHFELIPRNILCKPSPVPTSVESSPTPSTNTRRHSQVSEEIRIPESLVNDFGITPKAMRCLEIVESLSYMRELMSFSASQDAAPTTSLRNFASSLQMSMHGLGQNGSSPSAPSPSPHLQHLNTSITLNGPGPSQNGSSIQISPKDCKSTSPNGVKRRRESVMTEKDDNAVEAEKSTRSGKKAKT
ncbi:Adhesion defective protein 1, partial [Neolecta irregularis DAH-3]